MHRRIKFTDNLISRNVKTARFYEHFERLGDEKSKHFGCGYYIIALLHSLHSFNYLNFSNSLNFLNDSPLSCEQV